MRYQLLYTESKTPSATMLVRLIAADSIQVEMFSGDGAHPADFDGEAQISASPDLQMMYYTSGHWLTGLIEGEAGEGPCLRPPDWFIKSMIDLSYRQVRFPGSGRMGGSRGPGSFGLPP